MTLNLAELVGRVRILDGAWGTELQRLGLPAGAAPELWTRENAGAVEAVARSYVEAGSEIMLTNTFGANRYVLVTHGAAKRTEERAEAGAIVLETFNELAELCLAFRGVRRSCRLMIVVSMDFAPGPDGTATIMGDGPEDLAQMAEDHRAGAARANCVTTPERVGAVRAALRRRAQNGSR